jgi:hypothetical protein
MWFDFVLAQPGARRCVIDRIQQTKQLAGAVAVAQHGKRTHRPQRGVRALAPVLAHARNIAFDLTGIRFLFVERVL